MTREELVASVLEHRSLVASRLRSIADELMRRADIHDASKMEEPEAEMFSVWRPRLQAIQAAGGLESPEYAEALAAMGECLKHHYANNSHHPEYHAGGIGSMGIIDLIEMVCDWGAAASERSAPINWKYVTERFNIDDKLLGTLMALSAYSEIEGRNGGVEITQG